MLGIRKFIVEREHDIHIYTFIICKIHNKTPHTLSRLPTQSVHLQMDIDNSLIPPFMKSLLASLNDIFMNLWTKWKKLFMAALMLWWGRKWSRNGRKIWFAFRWQMKEQRGSWLTHNKNQSWYLKLLWAFETRQKLKLSLSTLMKKFPCEA